MAAGGRGVTLEDDQVMVVDRGERTVLAPLTEIPLLAGKGSEARLDVVMACAAALYCFGTSIDRITETLKGFIGGTAEPEE